MLRRVLCITLALSTIAMAQAAPDFKTDQKVEVREGDEWSAATVVKKEGRKIQIKYADGSEEWVTADRIRVPDGKRGATPPAVEGKKPEAKSGEAKIPEPKAAEAKPEKKDRTQWQIGENVQAKWGGLYRDAKINNKRTGDWYLVTWDKGPFQEWVEWWRIRKPGSTDDPIGYAQPNSGYKKGDDPPRPDAGDAPVERRLGAHADDAPKFEKPITEADTAGAKEILPVFNGAWSVAPDPEPAAEVTSQPIPLNSKAEHMRTQYLLQAGTSAAYVMIDEFGTQVKSITLEKIDLAAGSAATPVAVNMQSRPVAISPSGKLMMGRSNIWGFGGSKRLDVWSLGGGEPQHVISFNPHGTKAAPEADITAAGFISDELGFTTNSSALVVWNLPKAKAIWRCNLGNRGRVIASPGRKYLYVITGDDDLVCLDAPTGKPLGKIEDARSFGAAMDISPDGATLVIASRGLVSAYDLKTGQSLGGDIGVAKGVPTGGAVTALGGGFALLNNTTLFDLNKRLPVWSYTGGKDVFNVGGRCFAVVDADSRKLLASAKLPHDAARNAAAALKPDEAMLLQPGGKVSLDVNIAASPEETKAVIDGFTKQLEKNHITVDPAAPVRIVVRTEDGKTVQETWGTFGGAPWDRQQETVNVTDKITKVTIEAAALIAWETHAVNRPIGVVHAKPGQTIGQAVGDANKFNTAFLRSVHLPQYVMLPSDKPIQGESRWAMGGVKDNP